MNKVLFKKTLLSYKRIVCCTAVLLWEYLMNLHQLKAISRLQVTVTEGMDQLHLKKK